MRHIGIPGRASLVLLAGMALASATARTPEAQEPSPRSVHPAEAGCPVCELWEVHHELILHSQREVGPLENGVVYLVHAKEPEVIEPLIRFAYERAALTKALATRPELRERLGHACRHAAWAAGNVELQISTSAHGFFAILTSARAELVEGLKRDAQQAVRRSIPVWF